MSGGVVVKDRTKALLLLAGSRYDVYAPGPKAGRAFKHGKAAPTVKEICLLCDGDKITRDKFGREQTCESCKGRGWHKIDPMLNKEKQGERPWEEQALTSAGTRRVMCDRCGGSRRWKGEWCPSCDGAGKVSVPKVRPELSDDDRMTDVMLSHWEAAMERREKEGSYLEYDRCIAELVARSPHRHDVFHRVHVVKTASAGLLSGTEATLLQQAIRDLLKWMPHEIRVPAAICDIEKRGDKQPSPKGKYSRPKDREVRNDEIVAAHKAGKRTIEIAEQYGLTDRMVRLILDEALAA